MINHSSKYYFLVLFFVFASSCVKKEILDYKGLVPGVSTLNDFTNDQKFMMSIAGFEVDFFVKAFKASIGRDLYLKNVEKSQMDAFPTSDEERLRLMEEL